MPQSKPKHMNQFHFFQKPGKPIYIMIDARPELPYMTTIIAGHGVNSVSHCDNAEHVKRTLLSFADRMDAIPIAEAEFFKVWAEVDAVLSHNYTQFFNYHFGI